MTAVQPLDALAPLEQVGGKALNLSTLLRTGFPVPDGLVITTAAYRSYLTEHRIDAVIATAPQEIDPADQQALEGASATIRAAFAADPPPSLITQVTTTLGRLVDRPLAVRSSATAEDLPEASFAGQQDTFLNVRGVPALARAIVDCWSSLWTARAIAYRDTTGLTHADVALAVVVQVMVPAAASGVLFTANPLTGRRHEQVINATVGLGEALVSGQVEPDELVVDRTGRIHSQTLSARPARLSPAEVRALARLGTEIEVAFGGPQDIEWAIDDVGMPWVVQTRAITSLFPLPAGAPEDSLWLSFGAVQGVLEPITPLGQDAIQGLFAGLASLLGLATEAEGSAIIATAGERLWIRLDGLLQTAIGRRLVPRMLRMVEPGAVAAVTEFLPEKGGETLGLRLVRRARPVAFVLLSRLPQILIAPTTCRTALDRVAEDYVTQVDASFVTAAGERDAASRLKARVAATRRMTHAGLQVLVPRFVPVMATSLAAVERLNSLAHPLGDEGPGLVLQTLRALDGNVTTAMDLALWEVAKVVRTSPATLQRLKHDTAESVALQLAAGSLPTRVQAALSAFLDRYGMRGVAEIDVGRPRWREEPAPVIRAVSGFVADDQRDPERGLVEGRAAARAAIDELVRRLGPVRGVQARFLVRTVRALFGARETPKFTLVRALGLARTELLASGRDLVAEGLIDRPADIAWFSLEDLADLRSRSPEEWRTIVAERRARHARETRRQVPRVLLGDGRAYYAGLPDAEGVMTGSPVSPGVAEGIVRVLFDPAEATLEPGEILVCPGTDPAWTPLFLIAGGLITEVGGLMTHGAVVAREHGLPAVVGVHNATTRLVTGQRIRLDGSTGRIVVEP